MIYTIRIYQHSNPFNEEVGNIENEPTNKDFWAFAYKEDERATNLMCKPVKGRIKGDIYKYFYEYKTNGKDLKKNGVTLYARYFADTYEEAVRGFNILIQKRIDFLTKEIGRLQNMLIEQENNILKGIAND